jgi:ribosome-binding ATPase YchF (GTP1/OBG family)
MSDYTKKDVYVSLGEHQGHYKISKLFSKDELKSIKSLNLLSLKPELFILNIDEENNLQAT